MPEIDDEKNITNQHLNGGRLEQGMILKTDQDLPITVVSLLTDSGLKACYSVKYNDKKCVMIWRNRGLIKDPEAFYANFKNSFLNIGAKDSIFVWPEAFTKLEEGSFGYILRFRPEGFYSLSDFINGKVRFLSWRILIDSCITIIEACKRYHDKGYCLNCLIPDNIYINPTDSSVLIYGTENICPDGAINEETIGNVRYLAPENCCPGEKMWPTINSDRYSLAVMLFLLVCRNHPLEGVRWMTPCMTDEVCRKLYGTEALFIFDSHNDANAPVEGLHINALKIWKILPEYMKDAFEFAFCSESLRSPEKRPAETYWLDVFVRFKSSIVRCPCGNEVFANDLKNITCDLCGSELKTKHIIKLPNYDLLAVKGLKVLKCQLGIYNSTGLLDTIGVVVQAKDNPDLLGFKNLMLDSITVTRSGREKEVKPNDIVPIRSSIKISIGGKIIEFQELNDDDSNLEGNCMG